MPVSLRNTLNITLLLDDRNRGAPGIALAFGAGLGQAASVSLHDRGHEDTTTMRSDGALHAVA